MTDLPRTPDAHSGPWAHPPRKLEPASPLTSFAWLMLVLIGVLFWLGVAHMVGLL